MRLGVQPAPQHGPTDQILFLKDRQPDTGEPLREIYLPDVPEPSAHTAQQKTSHAPARLTSPFKILRDAERFPEKRYYKLRFKEWASVNGMHQHLVEKTASFCKEGGVKM